MSDSREELEARIAAYIDGQLSPAEAARLEVFLANTDPQLAERIIGMMGDRHRLRALPKAAAPADLAGRIMEQVERNSLLNDVEHMAHPRRGWWQSRGMVAAAIGLMVGGFAAIVAISVVGKQRTTLPPVALSGQRQMPLPGSTGIGAASDRESPGAAGSPPRDSTKGEESPPAKASDVAAAPASVLRKDLEKTEQSKAGAAEQGQVADADEARKAELEVRRELQNNLSVANNAPAAAKLGYKTVDSSEQALANISAGDSQAIKPGEPVVITLAARDEQDFARLRTALIDIVSQDPNTARRQELIQNRVSALYNGNGINGRFDGFKGGLTANSAPVHASRAENSSNSAATAPAATAIGAPATIAGSEAGGGGGGSGGGSGGGAGGGGGRGRGQGPNGPEVAGSSLAASAPAAPYQVLNDKKEFVPVPDTTPPAETKQAGAANQAPAGSLTSPAANAGGNLSNQAIQQTTNGSTGNSAVMPFGAGGGFQNDLAFENSAAPLYRVALRESQLRRLAAEFRVESVSRGSLAYVIAPAITDAPTATFQAKVPAAPSAAAAPAAFSNADPEKIRNDQVAAENQKQINPSGAGEVRQQAQPQVEALDNTRQPSGADKDMADKSGGWIECVITMEPQAPAANRHAAPPANGTQAK